MSGTDTAQTTRRVCRFCHADAQCDSKHTVEVTEDDLRLWVDRGWPPNSVSQDGFGDRGLNPLQSPIEAAYRRGVCQALSAALHHEWYYDRLERAANLALEYRYDLSPHGALLHELAAAVEVAQ